MYQQRLAMLAVIAATSAALAASCAGNNGVEESADSDDCVSNREFLIREAWPKVLGPICMNCHAPGGLASERGTDFQLQPPAYPGFVDTNLEKISTVARTTHDGVSILLRKPLGELDHGGAVQLGLESLEYGILAELQRRLAGEDPCLSEDVEDSHPVELLDAPRTLRKAALHLVGRLPTSDEVAALEDGDDDALAAAVDRLMEEEPFYDWLVETFNDRFLTDRYLNDAQGLLSDEDFPALDVYYEELPEEQQLAARRSIAREPLELIKYIVRHRRPFTEVVTADYTVLNGYTASAYNADEIAFDDAYDEHELREGHIYAIRDGHKLEYPHAGILSSPMFLRRFPTTPTNRNRHRARILLREFLATDILRIGDRPIDPRNASKYGNPTREDPTCTVCHSVLDPIAGAFMKFQNDGNLERFLPENEWHTDMFAPGFGDELMTVDDYEQSLPWVAARIAQDPRFPLAIVHQLLEALTTQSAADFPVDGEMDAVWAWELQDRELRGIVDTFVESNFDLKVAIRSVILSPYYRAFGALGDASEEPAPSEDAREERPPDERLRAYGTARFLTPEMLDRKLEALFGFTWTRSWDSRPYLLSEYSLLYGGIDSNTVTKRLEHPNGLMSAISWRLANEIACRAVPWEMSRSPGERRLITQASREDVPETADGFANDTSIARIRETIAHMFAYLLDEATTADSHQVDRVYQLFLDTWREGRDGLTEGSASVQLPWECQLRANPETNEELPEAQRLSNDEAYVIRAWMAVVTFFVADFEFLHQ